MKMSTDLPELKGLRDLKDCPKELFYAGDWEVGIFKKAVAVVGSRRMTEYGRQVLEKMIPQLVFAGKTIVSGFMYGVDQYAHQLAVDNGGKTIAVLGWGINERLADIDKRLGERIIASGGLLLSEWESQKAALWTFPRRNRIIAALATDVYVVEAGLKSGSLITAEWASKLNRKLWAVPGPVTSRYSQGTNWLIKSGAAEAWTPGEQTEFSRQDPVLNLLADEQLTATEIARKLNLDIAEIGARLTMMQLAGEIKERGGKYYAS